MKTKTKSTKTKKPATRSQSVRRSSKTTSSGPMGLSWKAIAAICLLLVVSTLLLVTGGKDKAATVTDAGDTSTVLPAQGNGTISLVANTESLQVGQTVEMEIYADAGPEAINVVQADLDYPASVLEFVSITESDSFANSAQSEGGNGIVKIARYTNPGETVTGRQLVGTVVFKAIASADTAQITVRDSSQVVRAEDSTDILQDVAVSASVTISQ